MPFQNTKTASICMCVSVLEIYVFTLDLEISVINDKMQYANVLRIDNMGTI